CCHTCDTTNNHNNSLYSTCIDELWRATWVLHNCGAWLSGQPAWAHRQFIWVLPSRGCSIPWPSIQPCSSNRTFLDEVCGAWLSGQPAWAY
ncbi:unnamed protein product, partial [Polarella glacialis]